MLELTHEQIQKIENYCEQQGVIFYDVKLEIVDHIANIVEQQQEQHPEMSFEDAFLNARKKLNIFFDELVKESAKQIVKQGKKAQLKFFTSFFRWPKMVVTFLFIGISIVLTYFSPSMAKYIALTILAPSMLLIIIYPEIFYGRVDNYIRPTIPFSKDKYVQVQPLLMFNRKNNLTLLAKIGTMLFNFSYLLFLNVENLHKDKIMNLFYFSLAGINFVGYLAFKEQRARLLQDAIKNYPEAFQSRQY